MFPCFPKRSHFIGDVDIKQQKATSKEIDKLMKREKRKYASRHNILLLGTGESGKSTFLKQMKIINGKRFTPEEIASFKDIIYDNIYKGILFLLDARENMNMKWSGGRVSIQAAERIEEHFKTHKMEHRARSSAGQLVWSEDGFLLLLIDFVTIWNDDAIKETFIQRSRIMTENFNYQPTNEDIVWSRKPTDSIIEEEIDVHGSCMMFIDVGGQTKERKKWCQMFQDMNSVLFLIACSHFDENYFDRTSKETRNKLREAMRVFEDLINVQYFLSISVIIFFNKTDVLTEKVESKLSNIREEFSEYPSNYDPHNLNQVKQFLIDTFVSFVDNPGANRRMLSTSAVAGNSTSGQARPSVMPKKRTLYRHFTTAIDQRNIETVFNAMKDTILQRNIDQLVMK